MKLQIFLFFTAISFAAKAQEKNLDTTLLQTVEVLSTIAGDKVPITKTNFSKQALKKENVGQDLPFILQSTPGLVANSDAGNGVGYTGLRLRGSDATRINITINGIPFNDAESQGTFLVNIPDVVSSTSSIQVQRGVGSSSNGAGAFGGSIHLKTNEIIKDRRTELNLVAGSFGTFKSTLINHTGLLDKKFTIDTRVSHIRSDGYIDRARSNLKSLYNSIALYKKKNNFRFNVLHGSEETYQAYYGVNDEQLKNNRTFNPAGTEKPGGPYDNEVDNYRQTHLHFFYNQEFSKYIKANLTLFYTHGTGYYEQYKANARLSSYDLPNYINGSDTIRRTDLVRRLWLRNNFFGALYNVQYEKNNTEIVTGLSANTYDGDHFGKIVSATVQAAIPKNHEWYDNNAIKKEFSAYSKWTEKLNRNFYSFIDLQVRTLSYNIDGFRNNPALLVDNNYTFFNPKAGISFRKNNYNAYLTYGKASKEPNRDDFETGIISAPKAETLNNIELGVGKKQSSFSWGMNTYFMSYKNQLVLTGQINDVGAFTRINIPKSHRMGMEMEMGIKINKFISFNANLALSSNRIKDFNEFIYDENGIAIINNYKNSTIAFSPSVVGFSNVDIRITEQLEINLPLKYVSRQYLDNTENKNRSLDAYFNQDMGIRYKMMPKKLKELEFFGRVNNVFNAKYAANGYTFSYIFASEQTTENYYFPMATRFYSVGMNLSF